MMRSALNAIDAHSETHRDDRRPHGHRHRRRASRPGLETILVLTGVTTREPTPSASRTAPSRIVDSVADLVDELG